MRTAGRTAHRCRQANEQPHRQRGEFRPGTGAAASRLALAREVAESTGYARLACLNAAARPGDYVPFAEVAAQALRVVSGYQMDQARIADVLAGLGELPTGRSNSHPRKA